MGSPPDTPVQISAQVVGNVFIEQYYKILHGSPQSVYKFYQDSSSISRQDVCGIITSVTTIQAIRKLMVSLEFEKYMTEIVSADSQQSYSGGVFLNVVGYLIKLEDKTGRKFSQSFFLAPQIGGGYFVMNDVFMFVDDYKPVFSLPSHPSEDASGKNTAVPINESAIPEAVQEELDESMSANSFSTEEVPPVNKTESSSETNDHKKDDYSVFIRNLHPLTSAVEVEVALKKFGPIKQGGLQVRSHKLRNICFAFVEFESLDSRQAAIEASSVDIGGRKAFISVKRTIPKANGVLGDMNSNISGRTGFSSGGRGGNFRNNYYNSGRGRGRGRFGFRNSFQNQNVQNKCGSSCSNVTNQATVAVRRLKKLIIPNNPTR